MFQIKDLNIRITAKLDIIIISHDIYPFEFEFKPYKQRGQHPDSTVREISQNYKEFDGALENPKNPKKPNTHRRAPPTCCVELIQCQIITIFGVLPVSVFYYLLFDSSV